MPGALDPCFLRGPNLLCPPFLRTHALPNAHDRWPSATRCTPVLFGATQQHRPSPSRTRPVANRAVEYRGLGSHWTPLIGPVSSICTQSPSRFIRCFIQMRPLKETPQEYIERFVWSGADESRDPPPWSATTLDRACSRATNVLPRRPDRPALTTERSATSRTDSRRDRQERRLNLHCSEYDPFGDTARRDFVAVGRCP